MGHSLYFCFARFIVTITRKEELRVHFVWSEVDFNISPVNFVYHLPSKDKAQ